MVSQKTAKKKHVYVLGLSNESASWHLLDPYQMFWPNMCICMPVYVQSCSAYSAEARRHFESICSTLSQRATQRCEIMSNSFETDTCSTRSLLIIRVCPPKMRNWTKPSSLCHFSMLYTHNTQRQSWFRPTTVKSSFPLRLPMVLPCITDHFTSNRRLMPRYNILEGEQNTNPSRAHIHFFVGNTYFKIETTIFHQRTPGNLHGYLKDHPIWQSVSNHDY